ncbi:NAD(P)H-dependent flavin oxidoreductase [Paraburkholderia caffeinilytica]|uniref:Propionate 3-nitronate monooxygenase n=1 Tax=Paraburkholderia caffeinilytica TaxID=1761016 RepID=A0ABQ1LW13_9BURK|nr:nitronate monooxygenase [Paraburkholderia caffeinilytica]GGC29059.1 2-nitropropane dioxygenase [Paraburkholderia caffeinilytica]
MTTFAEIERLLLRLGVAIPIIQAPMAGTGTMALAAAVSNAGALGSLAVGAMDPKAARQSIRGLRELTSKPFNVNVFAHVPPMPDLDRETRWIKFLAPLFGEVGSTPPARLTEIYRSFVADDAMLEVFLEERPQVVSFHLGLPSRERIAVLREAGIILFATATSVEEAQTIEGAGVDVIVAQGIEAGGHRGVFDPAANSDEALSTLALVSRLARQTSLPIVAAGGIMDGAGIAAALAAGAQAVQLGTAFILTPESAADSAYRAALTDPSAHTELTAAISGRPARCIANRFTEAGRRLDGVAIPDYPIAYDAGRALHAAAKAYGNLQFSAHWAGQGLALSRDMPAAQMVKVLAEELRKAAPTLCPH